MAAVILRRGVRCCCEGKEGSTIRAGTDNRAGKALVQDMTVTDVFKGKRREDWRTPKDLYRQLDNEFHFDFDPCPTNPTFDGLHTEWGKSNFVNPPYGRDIYKWFEKGFTEWQKNKTVVYLIFVQQSSTKAFHKYIYPYAEIRLLKGRLRFDDGKGSAPFGSMVAVLRPKYYV